MLAFSASGTKPKGVESMMLLEEVKGIEHSWPPADSSSLPRLASRVPHAVPRVSTLHRHPFGSRLDTAMWRHPCSILMTSLFNVLVITVDLCGLRGGAIFQVGQEEIIRSVC